VELHNSDGIAAARTMIALEANATALQSRLPGGWVLAPYAGDDLRGTSLRGANLLVPFHEVYGVRAGMDQTSALPQLSYIAFVSQAYEQSTGTLAHVHWFAYTEDPADVPGKYGDGKLAHIRRSQTFTKEQRGETEVRETFSAISGDGTVRLSLSYRQGGALLWVTADEPNLRLQAAKQPGVVRWYQEDQVLDVVRSDPLNINHVTEISLEVEGELADVFDGNERVVGVVIQRPYMRQVFEPVGQG
jgi:hypothetical protein